MPELRRDWSANEVALAVGAYFRMLRAEFEGTPLVKSHVNRDLRNHLDGRTRGAVELKFQNISAVCETLGVPRVSGYAPMRNIQQALIAEVEGAITANPELVAWIDRAADEVGAPPSREQVLLREVRPPARKHETRVRDAPRADTEYQPFDYALRDATNRALGQHGEEFVLAQERLRLRRIGKDSLADKIEHVAVTQGPRAGFDVHSYETNGTDRLIEVKTTNLTMHTSFYITQHELQTAARVRDHYHLFRVFSFSRDPRYFVLSGDPRKHLRLEPRIFTARR